MRDSLRVTGDDDAESADSFLAAVARIDSESAPERLQPGTRVGRFTLRAELGRGGMGVVYRAEDEQLGRSVALKMLRAGSDSDAARRARFLREARSAAALVHPNVAALYDIGEADGAQFIAMELIAGEDLRRVLARGPLPVAEAVRIGLGIARGVAAAHQRGIIHRDLKPENVMLDAEGQPKVLDFGLAKLTDAALAETPESARADHALTEEGLRLGTPGYMSPEQASGEALDARTDVFSFGVMLFELLAGRRPFLGSSRTEVLSALVRDPPPKLTSLRAEAPAALEELVGACLEKSPAARPATMRLVADALARIATEDPSGESAAARPRRPRGRWRTVMAVVAIVLAGAVATFALRTRTSQVLAVSDAASDAAAGSTRPTSQSITSYPPPKTNNPAAAAAYASAMQNLRDASIAQAQIDLERAVKLDPTFAAAHLRLLSTWWLGGSLNEAREHYAAASQFREALDDRDRLMLVVGEAVAQWPIDWPQVVHRLRTVLARYPDDVDALANLSQALLGMSDPPGSRGAAERTLVVDPQFAMGYWLLATTYYFDSADDLQRELEHCLAISPTAASCLRERDDVYMEQGRCAEYEETARKMIAIEPRGALAHLWLADALAVRGAPVESVKALLDKAALLAEEQYSPSASGERTINDIGLALLSGDFPAAIAGARTRERMDVNDTTELGHTASAMSTVASLEEQGRRAEALAVAEDFERRSPAWTRNDWTVRHYLLYARHHNKTVSDADFARDFAALEKEALAETSKRAGPAVQLKLRTEYADITDIPAALPFLDRPSFYAHGEAWRGRTLFLAGRFADAVAPLRAGAAICSILPTEGDDDDWFGYQAFGFMRAHLWLGEALEATGDTAGACTAYGVVLDRWKNARPRSITLDAARAHSRSLHCQ